MSWITLLQVTARHHDSGGSATVQITRAVAVTADFR